ncbi:MAG: adenosylcobinamide-GDP ribazoletransferase [Terracoccus sp.]
MRDAWRLAVGTFTALRVNPPSRVDEQVAGRAMLLAPATALPVLLVWVVLGAMAVAGVVPAAVAAVLTLIAVALVSRALHLDGLADTADGLTSGHDPERSLEVMRRGDTGPAGAASLVFVLLLQTVCLAALFNSASGVALASVALLTSRVAPAVASRRGVPPARPGGLGAAVAETVSPVAVAAVATGLLVAGTLVVLTVGGTAYAAGLVVVVGAAGAWLVVRHTVRRLGGITGDVIGAAIEVSLAAALVAASVAHGL